MESNTLPLEQRRNFDAAGVGGRGRVLSIIAEKDAARIKESRAKSTVSWRGGERAVTTLASGVPRGSCEVPVYARVGKEGLCEDGGNAIATAILPTDSDSA